MDWLFIQKVMDPRDGCQDVLFRVGAGCVRVGMRCIAVKRGDTYLSIENGPVPILRVSLTPFQGTVTSINAYDREVAELPAGWTGKMTISGIPFPLYEWDNLFLEPHA